MQNDALHYGSTIGDLFLRSILRNGNGWALADEADELTYLQFGERVCDWMTALSSLGLKRGDGIAQLSHNRCEAVCAVAAAFMLGLRYTPLHPLASEQDHAFILEDAEIACLVFDETSFGAHAIALKGRSTRNLAIVSHQSIRHANQSLPSLSNAGSPLKCVAAPDDIALIAYTGGTTGRPKGVVHRHRSLTANILISMAEWDWGEPLRFLAVTPVSHAAFLFILPVLLRGGMFCMRARFTAQSFAAAVEKHEISTTFLVPTMLYSLLETDFGDTALRRLQAVIYGAAPISTQKLRMAIERYGAKFMQLYGQTEAPNSIAALFRRDHNLGHPDRLLSCGVPLTGNQVKLLDGEGREVESGTPGEICVRGPLVMDGYWKRVKETEEAFAGGWLHTGDVGRFDKEGFLYIVDRKKDLVVTGGFNVYPREVEEIIETHPAVARCCVVGVPDDRWGEAVTAVVVRQDKASVSAEEITAMVRDAKGSVMAPKKVVFVETLPTTALGKIDRKSLRDRFWGGRTRNIN